MTSLSNQQSARGAITPALPGDAEAIYHLLAEAFGPSYLKFTVFQSTKASNFIRHQVVASRAAGAATFFVLREGGVLAGFYNAIRRGRQFFLNYIATAESIRSIGAGRRLMDHFETLGRAMGCESLGLDVFRSNGTASAWYARRGYQTRSVRYHMRFELEGWRRETPEELEVDQNLLNQALEVEGIRGFSCFSCVHSGKPMKLGLINGSVCNLLEPRGPAALEPASAVAQAFAGQRRWLLVTSQAAIPEARWAESVEEALYMTRPAVGTSDAR